MEVVTSSIKVKLTEREFEILTKAEEILDELREALYENDADYEMMERAEEASDKICLIRENFVRNKYSEYVAEVE